MTWTTYQADLTWPSRDEWAKGERTIYYGDEMPSKFFEPYKAMVPDSLRDAAVAELEALWKGLRTYIRGARGPIVDKLVRAGQLRYADAVDQIDTPADDALDLRHEVRRLITRDRVHVPSAYARCVEHFPVLGQTHPLSLVRQYEESLTQALRAADADWHHAVANTPIDDEAWAEELKRRARIEDDRQHLERFHHNV
jgi:hypothetical protein